jgi:hypothetical protein
VFLVTDFKLCESVLCINGIASNVSVTNYFEYVTEGGSCKTEK